METSNQKNFNILTKGGWNIPEKGDLDAFGFTTSATRRVIRGSTKVQRPLLQSSHARATRFMDLCHVSQVNNKDTSGLQTLSWKAKLVHCESFSKFIFKHNSRTTQPQPGWHELE
ncbi:hypothetical protein PoB_000795300 [Plakobranchus ocellatus]|uniref:Uncharacterized protein n=1 Tax=Plakobranchus ocellatus TaxID=259542 RepID=A0AAV3YGC6_9GAST|nr:hypothetical protein PoB_000795300 [Plakobranchus ocellatus]